VRRLEGDVAQRGDLEAAAVLGQAGDVLASEVLFRRADPDVAERLVGTLSTAAGTVSPPVVGTPAPASASRAPGSGASRRRTRWRRPSSALRTVIARSQAPTSPVGSASVVSAAMSASWTTSSASALAKRPETFHALRIIEAPCRRTRRAPAA